ncbi:hypothetical protein F5878DRAFT_274189 [Lentinula raphanica]|uniref:Uncharacterized protein n=1 Tax=Lentinula raphanica TaxID=153919 RepID=A0AA38P4V4_9AGAR|nr:hypothetical protein F5878DRAFT_274189 [Lentinula raphanica]
MGWMGWIGSSQTFNPFSLLFSSWPLGSTAGLSRYRMFFNSTEFHWRSTSCRGSTSSMSLLSASLPSSDVGVVHEQLPSHFPFFFFLPLLWYPSKVPSFPHDS